MHFDGEDRQPEAMENDLVIHEPENMRFILKLDESEDIAFLAYRIVEGACPQIWDFRHTFCPVSMRGKGVAGKVVAAAFQHARSNNIKVCIMKICHILPGAGVVFALGLLKALIWRRLLTSPKLLETLDCLNLIRYIFPSTLWSER